MKTLQELEAALTASQNELSVLQQEYNEAILREKAGIRLNVICQDTYFPESCYIIFTSVDHVSEDSFLLSYIQINSERSNFFNADLKQTEYNADHLMHHVYATNISLNDILPAEVAKALSINMQNEKGE